MSKKTPARQSKRLQAKFNKFNEAKDKYFTVRSVVTDVSKQLADKEINQDQQTNPTDGAKQLILANGSLVTDSSVVPDLVNLWVISLT